jgi:Ulp1 family protease
MKDRIHAAIRENVPQLENQWDNATEDQRDAICIALAHRIETLQSIELTDQDIKWLEGEA